MREQEGPWCPELFGYIDRHETTRRLSLYLSLRHDVFGLRRWRRRRYSCRPPRDEWRSTRLGIGCRASASASFQTEEEPLHAAPFPGRDVRPRSWGRRRNRQRRVPGFVPARTTASKHASCLEGRLDRPRAWASCSSISSRTGVQNRPISHRIGAGGKGGHGESPATPGIGAGLPCPSSTSGTSRCMRGVHHAFAYEKLSIAASRRGAWGSRAW